MVNESNLIWIDLEMTGLNTDTDHIIEIATIVTDKHLNILAEGPVIAIYQPEDVLEKMDAWNQKQHRESGLLDRVRHSTLSASDAQQQTVEFLEKYVPVGKSPMCGNSICQDRRFLYREMPTLQAYFHYRNLDVTTLKILAQYWKPDVYNAVKKQSAHLALDDIKESIAELIYYRSEFLRI